jgi:hypothetical protein
VLDVVDEQQKTLSRDVLEPGIRAAMAPAYSACAMERGSGSFNRMDATMGSHVRGHCSTMFLGVVREMERELHQLLVTLRGKLQDMLVGMAEGTETHLSTLW